MNESACKSIDEMNAARGGVDTTVVTSSLAMLGISCTCILASSPPLLWLYSHPMFFKIRPTTQLFFNNIATCLVLMGYLLPPITPGFPCWLELAIHVLGAAIVVATFTQRVLLFVIESEHTRLISETTPTMVITMGSRAFTVSELVKIRQYKHSIYLFFFIPPIATLMVSIAVFPQLQCTGCPLTWTFLCIVFVPCLLAMIIDILFIWTAMVKAYSDVHHVRTELSAMLFLGGVSVYTGYGLELGDPGAVHYHRTTSWRLVLSLGPLFFWFCSCAAPVLAALTSFRQTEEASVEVMGVDAAQYKRFYAFSVERLCVENLNFMNEVQAFRKGGGESQAVRITRRYIQPGAEQEVNISSAVRTHLLRRDGPTSGMFDEAYDEVHHMVISGTWMDFIQSEKKKFRLAS